MLKNSQRMTGTVKWYDDEKGFGFIQPDDRGKDIFLHRTALESGEEGYLSTGDRITFTVQEQNKGPAARDVKYCSENSEQEEVAQFDQALSGEDVNPETKFLDLGLIPEILRAIKDAGYKEPTPIQALAIPIVLEGKDMLGCAQTGTGKTAAFALPILQRLRKDLELQKQTRDLDSPKKKYSRRKIRVLVVAPTRELALQIENSFTSYGKYTGLRSTVVYGGVGQNPQVKKLKQGVDILVATPGRLLDLTRQGHINLSGVETLVLDEGDRMLDMGFIHDIRTIVKLIPPHNRQTLLFSATIPGEIKKLAQQILTNPLEINISPKQPTLEIIKQSIFLISRKKKPVLLKQILASSEITKALVFTRTKHTANRVVRDLKRKGVNAEPIHGNKSQTARQKALKNFRTGKTRVLVATDVASRGLDVDDISHVIQFDLPDVPETYLHRIGRTARAGAGGTAFAFCEEKEKQKLKDIEKIIRMRLEKVQNPLKIGKRLVKG